MRFQICLNKMHRRTTEQRGAHKFCANPFIMQIRGMNSLEDFGCRQKRIREIPKSILFAVAGNAKCHAMFFAHQFFVDTYTLIRSTTLWRHFGRTFGRRWIPHAAGTHKGDAECEGKDCTIEGSFCGRMHFPLLWLERRGKYPHDRIIGIGSMIIIIIGSYDGDMSRHRSVLDRNDNCHILLSIS